MREFVIIEARQHAERPRIARPVLLECRSVTGLEFVCRPVFDLAVEFDDDIDGVGFAMDVFDTDPAKNCFLVVGVVRGFVW